MTAREAVLFESAKPVVVEIEKQFRLAEQYIKQALIVFDTETGVDVPAVNELRYAGQHLLSGLTASNEERQLAQLEKALSHCHRASYDAVEASCLAMLENIDGFYHVTRGMIIADDIPDYAVHQVKVREIRDFIVIHSRDDAGAYWERLAGYFAELDKISKLFDAATPGIIQRHKDKKVSLHWLILIAIVSVLLTAGLTHYYH